MEQSDIRNPISEREMQIIRLAADGACDKEIAAKLGVTFPTVRTYWERIRNKTGTVSRTHATCTVLLTYRRNATSQ